MGCKHPIHFVGSIGFEDAESVFRRLGETVGDKAPYYPDGETGPRHNWVMWQKSVFEDHPGFEFSRTREALTEGAIGPPQYTLKMDPAELAFPPVGYAEEAITSYGKFAAMKADGIIPAGVRFQVSLPTPTAVVGTFVVPVDRPKVQAAYVRALATEVTDMLTYIAQDQLALQWDICHEILGYDGGMPLHITEPLQDTVELVAELSSDIPTVVQLGYHLCYGDPGHKHVIEPKDLATSVKFANALCRTVGRRSDFVHMAVPRDRNDPAYYAPLEELDIGDTRLILGLVHYTDGIAGTRDRLAVAEKYVRDFGIATECGFGRRAASTIPDLLRIHDAAAG